MRRIGTGAVLVEVDSAGYVVRTYTFPYGWGIYRVVPIALQTISDYDGVTRANNVTIHLTTLNDLGGPASIYYRINNGPTKSVASDGQPLIATQGTNNTLEYWSVDSNGIVELPHELLTGIGLENGSATPTTEVTQSVSGFNSNGMIAVAIAVIVIAVFTVALMLRRRRK